jgi:bleomycin hydrolase
MIDGDSADFVNLPINYIRNICKESIDNKQPIWFGADIHHYFDRNKGIADLNIYNYDFLHKMNQNDFEKGERLLFNQSVPNHAMLILGYDIDNNNKIKKWYIENSWGRKNNKGFISMSDNWFDNFVFEIVVKKECLNEKLMNKINFKKKTKIYPWKIISCEALSVV